MVKHAVVTTASVLEKVKQHIAILPSQEEYIKNLAAILTMHLNRNRLIDRGYSPDELPAPSAIIVAPTGQGKTYLLRKMATCLDLNLITIDCSTLVGESYKGVSLSQRIAGAMEEAKTQRGFMQSLVLFDEVDKLVLREYQQSSGMTAILQMFNGGSIAVSKGDNLSKHIDVSRFTILLAGAFVGLEDIIRTRICPHTKIGFTAGNSEQKSDVEWMQHVTLEDVARFGIMKELLGRIGTILTIQPLNFEDYVQLLNAESGSIRKKYEVYFRELYDIHFEMSDACVDFLAKQCMTSIYGARSVTPLVNDLLRSVIPEVESNKQVCKIIFDCDMDKCYVRYEYREYGRETLASLSERLAQVQWHTIKAKNENALVRKLCRYYRNSDAYVHPETSSQLEAFLRCVIPFLHGAYAESDFVFESLEKLAHNTHREDGNSIFDTLLKKSVHVRKEDYQYYDLHYTNQTCQNLEYALNAIFLYIVDMHGTDKIKCLIQKKK